MITLELKKIKTYKDAFQLAKKAKLMKAFRDTLIILTNELTGLKNPTPIQTMEYLLNINAIPTESLGFINWLKNWNDFIEEHYCEFNNRLQLQLGYRCIRIDEKGEENR